MCMLHAQSVLQVNFHQLLGLRDVLHATLGTIPTTPQLDALHALLDQQLPSQELPSAFNANLEHFLMRLPHQYVMHALLGPILHSMQQLAPPVHQEQEVSNIQHQVNLTSCLPQSAASATACISFILAQ